MPCQYLMSVRLDGEGKVRMESKNVLVGHTPVWDIVKPTKSTSFWANWNWVEDDAIRCTSAQEVPGPVVLLLDGVIVEEGVVHASAGPLGVLEEPVHAFGQSIAAGFEALGS